MSGTARAAATPRTSSSTPRLRMGNMSTPAARFSLGGGSAALPSAWRSTSSSSVTPTPKRRARPHRPPMLRAAISRMRGPQGDSRSSACTGPSTSPSAAQPSDTARATASCKGAACREGVT